MDEFMGSRAHLHIPTAADIRASVIPLGERKREPEDCDRNPWGLSPAECDVMDTMVREGEHQHARRALRIGATTLQAHISSAKSKMNVTSVVRACVLWDRFRRPDGRLS